MSELEASRTAPAARKLSVIEAQDAIAATFGDLEKLAWRFFVIARDLEADLDDESFPDQEPGPDHLRWFTALSAMALYTELIELLPLARKAAERGHQNVVDEWEKKHSASGASARAVPSKPKQTKRKQRLQT
jgi:hypothetical protein